MNLDKHTASKIKNIVQSENWDCLVLVAEELREQMVKNSIPSDSEWEIVKYSLLREGKISGIRIFLDTLKKISDQNEPNIAE
jgi:hypothetical protein